MRPSCFSFVRPLAEGQGVPVFFHPAPFLGRNHLTQTRTVARNSDPPAAQHASVTERNGPRGWRACSEATAHNIKRREAGTAGGPAPLGDVVLPAVPRGAARPATRL